ncbi:hypothetical protein AB0N77_20430 [Streptomyces misionensis]|uniref:hypothetical protein n=1 Tax=Streptomyces misionensis TaxID=67331 RepID=UPI00342AAAF3
MSAFTADTLLVLASAGFLIGALLAWTGTAPLPSANGTTVVLACFAFPCVLQHIARRRR